MSVEVKEIDIREFNAVVRELSRISGTDFKVVLRAQVGAVLKASIKLTAAASRSSIVSRMSKGGSFVKFADGTVIARWKKAGDAEMFLDESNWNGKGKAPLTIGGKTWHQMNDPKRRWSDDRWGRYQNFESRAQAQFKQNQKATREAALKARGLAKQSWLQIGHSLGIAATLGAPGFVAKATPSNGRRYQNGTAVQEASGDAFTITGRNDSNLITHFRRPSGWGIIERAIQMRVKAFHDDMERGVFADVKRRAQRYPGVFTTN